MKLQILCGECSARVVVDVPDGATAATLTKAALDALRAHYDDVGHSA